MLKQQKTLVNIPGIPPQKTGRQFRTQDQTLTSHHKYGKSKKSDNGERIK